MKETVQLILKARGLAHKFNNSKFIKLLNLSLGYLCATDSLNINNQRYIEIVKQEVFAYEKSADNELEHYFNPFKSFVYYLEGNFIKSINCVFYYSDIKNVPENLYLRLSFTYSAMSAIVNGEHDIALTILNKGIEFTNSNELLALSNEILLVFRAFVYMLKGNDRELKRVIDSHKLKRAANNFTMGDLWLTRIQSYYYYLKNDIKKSHSYYLEGMKHAVDRGFLGYILAPFMLKVLAQYNILGLNEPSSTSFIDEIKIALNSPSILHQIIENRELSQIISHQESWKNIDAQKFIHASMQLAYTISAPLERAQTMIVYIKMMAELNRLSEATQVIDELLNIKSRYPQLDIPKSTDEIISNYTEKFTKKYIKKEKIHDDNNIVYSDSLTKDGHVYECEKMKQLEKRIRIIASKNVSVLIQGESGVGKEHIAQQLHNLSGRKGRFVAVNLTSIPEDLFESEFYGHEKGAFTGAISSKKGLFETANNGTLFLDEIGDTSLRIQAKLLRVLQEKEFMRVGGTSIIKSEFRLISATNKNLREAILENSFREDLYYRLNVISLEVPALRDRDRDIILIAQSFLNYYCQQYKISKLVFSNDDISFLKSYSWPGNVRELKNYIERYVLLSEHSTNTNIRLLASHAISNKKTAFEPQNHLENIEKNFFHQCANNYSDSSLPTINELISQYIEYVYILKNGNVGGPDGIAKTLDISKVTTYNWINKLKLNKRFTKKIIIKK
jgi:transcriptional regulator with GAF, ATPase, and Fis domain